MEENLVRIPFDSIYLEGLLKVPKSAMALVIFVHGSGSSRLSPRNNYVADVLNRAGLATLLFDLLTEEEDQIYETRFDIDLLVERLKVVTDWAKKYELTKGLTLGYFGASTGAAAAIKAAADLGEDIKALVSRGGRPDLAGEALSKIKSPILLIVGGDDEEVIRLNEQASALIATEKKLSVIPGATHLFEEEGTLEKVAEEAVEWFNKYL